MELAGIGSDRLYLRWVSSAEGRLFADYATEVSEAVTRLGPFDPAAHRLALSAVRRTLEIPRVRWLTGMERDLVEKENVYHRKIAVDDYRRVLQTTIQQEYERALVAEALAGAPSFVAQIADRTGLARETVAGHLVDLQQAGQANVAGYEDQHPRFVGVGE